MSAYPQGASAPTVSAVTAREDRLIYRALKLVENRLRVPGQGMTSPQHVRDYLRLLLAELEREVFVCLFLDTQNCLIEAETLFYGSLTITSVYPREVVKRSLHYNAAAVIFAHNHPSGRVNPSEADLVLTSALMDTLRLVDVKVLDHFIVAGLNAVSLGEMGLLGHRELPDLSEKQGATEKPLRRKQKATTRITHQAPGATTCHSS